MQKNTVKKSIRLYNVMFPLWFFFFYPTVLWLIIIPVNFVIDTLVLFLSAKHEGVEDRKTLWKQTILRIFLIGFLSDAIGGLACLGILVLSDFIPFMETLSNLSSILTQFVSGIPGVIVAGFLIFFLNRWLSFRKTDLSKETIHKICLALAIFTAPYTMLIPLYW